MPTLTPDQIVSQLLDRFEARIDLDHVAAVRARHRAALTYQPVDRLPLVFYLPYEGQDIRPYPFAEAFEDPAKLMANELLAGFTSIHHALDLRDDAPYCLRPNLGTGIVASMFGSFIRLLENNPPWAEALGGLDALRTVAEGPLPPVTAGLGQRVIDQFAYFHAALADYPRCRAAFQITLPDLQGPFSTVELLWGSSIYVDLYDHADLVHALLAKVTAQMIAAVEAWRPYVREDIGAGFTWQHNVGVRGNLLIRDNSMILISPAMYREIVLPYDAKLCAAVGGAGIHFCGAGGHQVPNLLTIPACQTIDFGQPELNDLDAIYAQAAPRQVALTRFGVPPEALRAGPLKARFPTGVTLIHHPASVEEAHQLWAQYTA